MRGGRATISDHDDPHRNRGIRPGEGPGVHAALVGASAASAEVGHSPVPWHVQRPSHGRRPAREVGRVEAITGDHPRGARQRELLQPSAIASSSMKLCRAPSSYLACPAIRSTRSRSSRASQCAAPRVCATAIRSRSGARLECPRNPSAAIFERKPATIFRPTTPSHWRQPGRTVCGRRPFSTSTLTCALLSIGAEDPPRAEHSRQSVGRGDRQ